MAPAEKLLPCDAEFYFFLELVFFLLELLFFTGLWLFDVALAIVWCLDDP